MKSLITLLLLFSSFLQAFEAKSKVFKEKFNGSEYKLVLKVSDMRSWYGLGQLYEFSVYKDGNFLHANNQLVDAGRFVGCRTSGSKKSADEKLIADIVRRDDEYFYWLIKDEGPFCDAMYGLSTSYNIIFINPKQLKEGYMQINFDSQSDFKLDVNDEAIELFYFEQDWGSGGNITSIYVPKRDQFNIPDGSNRKDIMIRIDQLKQFESIPWRATEFDGKDKRGLVGLDFLSLYQSAMDNHNWKLLEYALDNYWDESSKSIYWYAEFLGMKESDVNKSFFLKTLKSLKEYAEYNPTIKFDSNYYNN